MGLPKVSQNLWNKNNNSTISDITRFRADVSLNIKMADNVKEKNSSMTQDNVSKSSHQATIPNHILRLWWLIMQNKQINTYEEPKKNNK